MFTGSTPPSPPRPPKFLPKDQPTPPKACLNDPWTPKTIELLRDNSGGQARWFVQYIWGLRARFRFALRNPMRNPPSHMNLVISSLRWQYHLVQGSVAIREVIFYQEAGIGQGDPFSPQLFSFCAAIIIYPLRQLRVTMGMRLYVDDFLITFGQVATKWHLIKVFHEFKRFLAVSGLQQNVCKSAYVTKGTLQPEALRSMQNWGVRHETRVRYFGVLMGHVPVKEAFVGPLREAYRTE